MMTKALHPHYLKASKLIFLSGGIFILHAVFTRDLQAVESNEGLGVLVAGLLMFGMGWLVRRGHGWIRYVLLALFMASVFLVSQAAWHQIAGLVNVVLDIVVNVLQLWAMVLLFMVQAKNLQENSLKFKV